MHDTPKKPRNVPLPQRPGGVEEPWYQMGLRFRCTQCGNCCSGGPGFVWLSLLDMQRISAFLNMEFDAFTRRYVRQVRGGFSLVEKPDYDCVFLKRAGGKAMCGIYPVRPGQCRTWPFWNQNLQTPEHWTHAAGRCPGMCDGDAPLYDVAQIEAGRNHPESPE